MPPALKTTCCASSSGFARVDGVSDRQWRDVLGILRVSGPSLDRDYLRQWAVRLGVGDLLDQAFAQRASES